MCNYDERKLTKEEKQQYTIGYKVFCTTIYKKHNRNRRKTGLFSVYTHDTEKENGGFCLEFYDYSINVDKDGFFETKVEKELNPSESPQLGFHVFINLEDAERLLEAELWRSDWEDFAIYKVAIRDVVAIGKYNSADVVRCGKIMVISEDLAKVSYNSPL